MELSTRRRVINSCILWDIKGDDAAAASTHVTVVEEIGNWGESVELKHLGKNPPGKDDFPASRTSVNKLACTLSPGQRSERRLKRLNTELLKAIQGRNFNYAEQLINTGANPNATCREEYVSACHIAALSGQADTLKLLLTEGSERNMIDKLGRTPLHLAIWGGHVKCVALLLDMPDNIVEGVYDNRMFDFNIEITKEKYTDLINSRIMRMDASYYDTIPDIWKDTIEHQCTDLEGALTVMEDRWTHLHVAAAVCRPHCIEFLLAAGTDLSVQDLKGRTPLDVAGIACLERRNEPDDENADFIEVLQVLMRSQAPFSSMQKHGIDKFTSPLHTATRMSSLDGIKKLLEYGAYPGILDESGETPLHLAVYQKDNESLQLLLNHLKTDGLSQIVDVKNDKGDTILETSIREEWIHGVCLALENGANIAEESGNGNTTLHVAAFLGNVDILNEILASIKGTDIIDLRNDEQETALFKAVKSGSFTCVKALLNAGASVKTILPQSVTILHVAAEIGKIDVLEEILNVVQQVDASLIDALTDNDKKGYAPLHVATVNNHSGCVRKLLKSNANIKCKTKLKTMGRFYKLSPNFKTTALHLCAAFNLMEVAQVLIDFDKTILNEVDGHGRLPIHLALLYRSKELIRLFLQAGSDLSATFENTARNKRCGLDLLLTYMPRPTDFLEELFDSFITTHNSSTEEPSCEISVDLSVLMPRKEEGNEMKVLTGLIRTGNSFGQRRLLLHPVIRSFIYLKWHESFNIILSLLLTFTFFVFALTGKAVSMFYFSNRENEIFNFVDWTKVHVAGTAFVVIQECILMSLHGLNYFSMLGSWMKWCCLLLSLVLPLNPYIDPSITWSRPVAACSILLAWMRLTYMISPYFSSGYYVLMFSKVAKTVIKILLLFLFLIIGFSISFMVLFALKEPFQNPWSAFVKTMVMMSSELDYSANFQDKNPIIKIVFILFLVLIAVVVMNLLTGVAVNDINELEKDGFIHKLARRVNLLGTFDDLIHDGVFTRFVPKSLINRLRPKRITRIYLHPGKPSWKTDKPIPRRLKDDILLRAIRNENLDDSEAISCILKEVSELREIVQKDSSEIEPPEKNAKQEDESKDSKKSNEFVENILNKLEDYDDSLKRVENHLINLGLKINDIEK